MAEAADAADELECKICYNLFDLDLHTPKLLSCSHTFCQVCLDTLHAREGRGWRVGCPVCRHRTPVPEHRVRNIATNHELCAALHGRPQPLEEEDGEACTSTSTGTQAEARVEALSSVTPWDATDDCESCKHAAFALSCVCAIFSTLAMVVLLFLGLVFVHNFNHVTSPVGPVCLFVASVLALFSLILTWLICMLRYRPDAEASGFSSVTSNVM
ncbi:unnamed protein product [Ophioblennius macclurei]